MLVVSSERELDPHLSDTKEQSLVELIDLGDPEKVDRDGIISSATTVRHFARKTRTLLVRPSTKVF